MHDDSNNQTKNLNVYIERDAMARKMFMNWSVYHACCRNILRSSEGMSLCTFQDCTKDAGGHRDCISGRDGRGGTLCSNVARMIGEMQCWWERDKLLFVSPLMFVMSSASPFASVLVGSSGFKTWQSQRQAINIWKRWISNAEIAITSPHQFSIPDFRLIGDPVRT